MSFPLKEGLRHQERQLCYRWLWNVEMSFPLKEGLRREVVKMLKTDVEGRNVFSIKRRIATKQSAVIIITITTR